MPPASDRAVFLSYASQDAGAVRRLCEALRAVGIEVWFDQNELTGGDAWDAKIRKQIADCALFVPVISANTQARREGYFRLEWRIAAQRTHMMSEQIAFLLPVVIDDTRDAEADVPGEFKAVQWTRLPGGETNAAFCSRVKKLLVGETASATNRSPAAATPSVPTAPAKRRLWLVPVLSALAIGVAVALWQPWKKNVSAVTAPPAASVPTAALGAATEIAQVRSKLRPDEWTRADFNAFVPVVDRLIQTYPENGDAWALRSIAHSLLVIRNLDTGTKPLEEGKAAIDTALRIAPDSPLAELGLGLHLVAMISRGGDIRACRPHIDRGLTGLPTEPLARYAELVSYWLGYQIEGSDKSARQWLAAEPKASFPAWILAQSYVQRRQPAEGVKWAEQAAADPDITGARSLVTLFEAHYYLAADLPAARAALDRVPVVQRGVHRVVASRFWLAMAERHFDQALQELARVPESMLFDRVYHGPKALLVGLAHQAAGRAEVAQSQFRDAERMLRDELTHDAENLELRAVLALNLALLGRADDARRELAAVEPLLAGQEPTVYSGQLVALIAQTHGVLGEKEALARWLRRNLTEISPLPFTPASLRLDVRFAAFVDFPEVQALLKEFAALDQSPASAIPATADQKSVAVLAFKNLSDDKNNEYFSDGISEELLNVLGQVPGLHVAAPMSAFSFKGKNTPTPEIGRLLNVVYLIDGSVEKIGTSMRIRARLSRAETNEQIWSATYAREAKDVFALEDEIARDIAAKFQLALVPLGAAAKREIDPEAHRLVLEARKNWTARTDEGLAKAEELFSQALLIEPKLAAAHSGLAEVFSLRGLFRQNEGLGDGQAEIARALTEAQSALALDATQVEAHTAAGFAQAIGHHWVEAERSFQRALELNQNDALTHVQYNALWWERGRFDLAMAELDKAIALDPLSSTGFVLQTWNLVSVRRFEEALAMSARAVPPAPGMAMFLLGLRAEILLALGRNDEAIAVAREITHNPQLPRRWYADSQAIWLLRRMGFKAEAEAHAAAMFQRWTADSYLRGFALAALDRPGEALPFLEHTPPATIRVLYVSEMFESLRADPRFLQLMAKLGCTEEYKTARETLARMRPEHTVKK